MRFKLFIVLLRSVILLLVIIAVAGCVGDNQLGPNGDGFSMVDDSGIHVLTESDGNIDFSSYTNSAGNIIPKAARFISKSTNTSRAERDKLRITNVAWGFMAWNSIKSELYRYKMNATAITNEGRIYHGRIEVDAGFNTFAAWAKSNGVAPKEHQVLDFDKNGIEYWWFDGAAWITAHSPEFMNFLKYQVDNALKADVKALLFDGQTMSALAVKPSCQDPTNPQCSVGDFSPQAMEAFTTFLKENYSAEILSNLGIDDIDSFNYHNFLNDHGISTAAQYISRLTNEQNPVPLHEVFALFNNKKVNEITKELILYARSIDPDIIVGTSSPLDDPYRATNIDEVTYFMLESFFSLERAPYAFDTLISYKLAEAMNKPLVITSLFFDWQAMKHRWLDEQYGLIWLAEAYANGANFIFPARQFAGGAEEYNPTTEIAAIYQLFASFIETNESLFNDYKTIKGKVLVVQSWEALRKGNNKINSIITALRERNIPFDIEVAGDKFQPNILSSSLLDSYDKVIISSDEYSHFLGSNPVTKSNLDSLQSDKLIKWQTNSDVSKIESDIISGFSVSSESKIIDEKMTIVPRAATEDKPYVIHLVNKDYNPSIKSFTEYNNIELLIDADAFPEEITRAQMHIPGQDVQSVEVNTIAGTTTISGINGVEIWGLLELMHTN